MADAVEPGLNDVVEVTGSGNCFASGIIPRPGTFELGDAGLEFIPEDERGRVQVPWDAIVSVDVDLFRGCVRSMEIHASTGLVHVIVIDEDVAALRCMRDHIGREKIVDVNARAREQGPLGSGALATAKALLTSWKR
jgi:hypothetical protein